REAERRLEAAQLRREKANRNFDQLKELHERNFVGQKEYLDAETDFRLAELDLEIAQARLEDTQEDLSQTSIPAPPDRVQTLLTVVDGQVISSATSASNGTELITLSQLSDLYMEANISEVDVERLSIGQEARLTFDAIQGFSITGKIA